MLLEEKKKNNLCHGEWSHLEIHRPLCGVVDEVAGQGAGCSPVSQDDRVFGLLAPVDEEFSGEARLEVRLAAEDHLGTGNPG